MNGERDHWSAGVNLDSTGGAALSYREENFGFPAARVGGKPTMGTILSLPMSRSGWPGLTDEDCQSLRQWLEEAVGGERAFIEETKLRGQQEVGIVEVKLRVLRDESDEEIAGVLAPAADAWLRKHVAGLHAGDLSAP